VKITPLGDRVLLKPSLEETKTTSGIIIPDTAKEKTQTGEVLAIGDDSDKIKIKKGDRVLYDKYAGTQVTLDDEEYLVVKVEDVLAVIG